MPRIILEREMISAGFSLRAYQSCSTRKLSQSDLLLVNGAKDNVSFTLPILLFFFDHIESTSSLWAFKIRRIRINENIVFSEISYHWENEARIFHGEFWESNTIHTTPHAVIRIIFGTLVLFWRRSVQHISTRVKSRDTDCQLRETSIPNSWNTLSKR